MRRYPNSKGTEANEMGKRSTKSARWHSRWNPQNNNHPRRVREKESPLIGTLLHDKRRASGSL